MHQKRKTQQLFADINIQMSPWVSSQMVSWNLYWKNGLSKKGSYYSGDFNIKLLNCNIYKNTFDYVDILYSRTFFPTIYSPTRITSNSKTLIDNIFCNNVTKNITTSLSDCLTQFLSISNQYSFSKHQMLNTDESKSSRNINSMAFEDELKRIIGKKHSSCLRKILTRY